MTMLNARYELLSEFGRGGMGVVYRAHDRLLQHDVALKQVTHTLNDLDFATKPENDTDTNIALAHEFQVLARLRHPHIISVLDFGFSDDSVPFYTMELLEDGIPITRHAHQVDDKTKQDLIIQMLQAIQYLHRNHLLHRDIKPDNILVSNGQVKVLDFGLAVRKDYDSDNLPVGTMPYLAPEVIGGQPATLASDLFALGILIHQIMTGQHPFRGKSIAHTITRIMNDDLDFASLDVDEKIQGILSGLLARVPSQRFATVEAVLSRLSDKRKTLETTRIRDSFLKAAEFVGRKTELAQLGDALKQSQAGKGSAWLIGGESGVGKTRLVDELRIRALTANVLVLSGQARSDFNAPFQMWQSILRLLLLNMTVTDEEAQHLQHIIGDLSTLMKRDVVVTSALEPQVLRAKLLAIITDLFERLDQPALIILEDIHWAQDDLSLLQNLLKRIDSLSLLIVATYRNDEAIDLPQTLPDMRLMKLPRLNKADIEALSVSMLGGNARDNQLQELLQRETEGNVFFLVEVMRTLAQNVGDLNAIGRATLPAQVFAEGVQALVQRRLDRIPPRYYPLLQITALAGRQLDLQLLEHVADADIDLPLWLSFCVEAFVLEALGENWQFAHDKVRETIIANLDPLLTQDMNKIIAEALETLYPNDNTLAVRLAHHWQQAHNREKEGYYSLLAGQSALATATYPTAQKYLDRALNLSDQVTIPNLHPALLRLWLGDVYYSLGDYDKAKSTLEKGKSFAEATSDNRGLARIYNLLGNIALARGNLDSAQELLEASVRTGRDTGDTLEIGKSTRSLGLIADTRHQPDKARALFQESLGYLQAVNDSLGIAGAYSNLANLARQDGDYETAQALYQQAIEGFESIDFAWGIAFTLTNLALVQDTLQNYDTAMGNHQRAIQICRDIQHQWGLAYALGNLARTAIAIEAFDTAKTALSEARTITHSINTLPLMMDLLAIQSQLLASQNATLQALTLLEFVMEDTRTEAITKHEFQALLDELRENVTEDEYAVILNEKNDLTLDGIQDWI